MTDIIRNWIFGPSDFEKPDPVKKVKKKPKEESKKEPKEKEFKRYEDE